MEFPVVSMKFIQDILHENATHMQMQGSNESVGMRLLTNINNW